MELSNCCGAKIKEVTENLGRCSECGEGCGVEEENECDCCMWDDMGYTHEPQCSSLSKLSEEKK